VIPIDFSSRQFAQAIGIVLNHFTDETVILCIHILVGEIDANAVSFCVGIVRWLRNVLYLSQI